MGNIRKIYSKIYDENVEKIYRFVFLKVSSKEVAEDITSDTFLKGWEAINNGKDEIKNPRAFLYQIARNLVVDHYRIKGRTQAMPEEYAAALADPSPTTEERAIFNSDINNIKLALNKLNNDYKDVIILRYIDDLQVPEIARALDKSEGAVRVMLHRALSALKEEVKEA